MVPLLIVRAELLAAFDSRESTLHSPWGPLGICHGSLLKAAPSSVTATRSPFFNVRWAWPGVRKISSIASLGAWSPGKCLALDFSGTLLVCPSTQGIFLCDLCSPAVEGALEMEIPGVEMRAEGKHLVPGE